MITTAATKDVLAGMTTPPNTPNSSPESDPPSTDDLSLTKHSAPEVRAAGEPADATVVLPTASEAGGRDAQGADEAAADATVTLPTTTPASADATMVLPAASGPADSAAPAAADAQAGADATVVLPAAPVAADDTVVLPDAQGSEAGAVATPAADATVAPEGAAESGAGDSAGSTLSFDKAADASVESPAEAVMEDSPAPAVSFGKASAEAAAEPVVADSPGPVVPLGKVPGEAVAEGSGAPAVNFGKASAAEGAGATAVQENAAPEAPAPAATEPTPGDVTSAVAAEAPASAAAQGSAPGAPAAAGPTPADGGSALGAEAPAPAAAQAAAPTGAAPADAAATPAAAGPTPGDGASAPGADAPAPAAAQGTAPGAPAAAGPTPGDGGSVLGAEAPPAPGAPHAHAYPYPAPVRSAFAPPTAADLAAGREAQAAYAAQAAQPVPAGHGGGGDAWGQPPVGQGPYPGFVPSAPRPAGNGLAVAAVILGSFGIFLGVIPFLFWAGTLLALLAIGLGIGGIVRASKGAPNRVMAIVGTVLGGLGLLASVGGFFITVAVIDEPGRFERTGDHGYGRDHDFGFDGEGDEFYPGEDEDWPTAPPSPSQVPGLTSALPFGETFTYPNGVKVSLSAPTAYQPKGSLARERVKNAVQLTVTITNGSTAPHEVIYAMPNVRDDKGMTADLVFDSGGSGGSAVPKMIKGSILPGESASGVVAFEIPEGTKSITADISAGTRLERVMYSGPIAR
ncbi:hypothetical protein [Streptomyces sp. NPDC047014]|uniref:hypothetical protein n=1 Tax=Streptomyces sp. NPDC047014 TaxID=3155736 RepID=UPI0034024CB8